MMSRETIHSGHFMTSNPHTDPAPDDEDEDVEVDVVEDDEKLLVDDNKANTGKEVVPTDEKPVTFYKFGPQKTQSIAIDVSLNKLNRCIKVAYNKMTTPKWKDFKGLRLHWKQRIRLNNVIWRAYHMEFGRLAKEKLKKKKTPYCYFAVPDDDTTHAKIEGAVMEGMYWKRRMEAVCAQYKRWRHYMRARNTHGHHHQKRKRKVSGTKGVSFGEPPPKSQTPKNTSTEWFDIDDLENEFTDTLFDSLNQPYMFPNPREMMQSGNADIMQPGLLSLQPSLEEIMASLVDDDQFPDPPMSLPSTSRNMQSSRTHENNLINQNNGYSSKDYVAANMLLDYRGVVAGSSNQPPSVSQQPTRHSISSPLLMAQPQYSTAIYDQRNTWKQGANSSFLVTGGDVVGNMDYIPQFLHSVPSTSYRTSTPQTISSPLTILPNSNNTRHWLDSPFSYRAVLPLPPSPLVPPSQPDSIPPPRVKASTMRPEGVRIESVLTPNIKPFESKSTSFPKEEPWPQPMSDALRSRSVEERPPREWRGVEEYKEEKVKEEPMAERSGKRGQRVQQPADSTLHPTERKRILHLHAEQSRRIALKDGFEQLMDIVPDISSGGVKPTNAVVLAKAADYIKALRISKQRRTGEANELKNTITALNRRIANLQSNLPSNRRDAAVKIDQRAVVEQFFERYTKEKSREDWRFWLMARLLQPIVSSYAASIYPDAASRDELSASCSNWLASNWQVSKLRPLASAVLVYLATSTQVLSNPDTLRQHVEDQVGGR